MSWRDNLLAGSFRSLAFHFQESVANTGRRLQVHSYPMRDSSYVEDLGAIAKEWALELFVFGVDYAAQRDALTTALEKQGAGELVHPRLGRLWVRVAEVSISESTSDGGYAAFSVRFVDAGERPLPVSSANTLSQVKSACDELNAAASNAAQEHLSFDNGLSLEAGVDLMQGVASDLQQINGRIDAALYPLSEMANSIETIGQEAATLLNTPREAVDSIANVAFAIYGATGTVKRALQNFGDLDGAFEFEAVAPNSTTTNIVINSNQQVLSASLQAVNVTNAVRTISDMAYITNAEASQSPFESYGEVIAVRDQLINRLDSVADVLGDEFFDLVQTLKIRFNQHLKNHGMRLPRIKNKQLNERQPALVLAYQLTGDAMQVDDLAARNKLKQPLFVERNANVEYLEAIA